MKIPELVIGIAIGLLLAGTFNFAYRWYFVYELKQEPLDVQAQYKLNRIKSLMEAYE